MEACIELFSIGRAQKTLPPIYDAAKFLILRSYYQESIWNQEHLQHADHPPVTEMGWMCLASATATLSVTYPKIKSLQ